MAEGPPTIESKPLTLVYDMPIGKIRKFWEGIKKGKIYTSRCMKCGKLYFPPVGDCGLCLSSDMEWVELSGEAEVETFSHIPVRPASFQQHEPYTITIGRLKEGIRVLAWLNGVESSNVKVGMKVKLKAKVTAEDLLTYEFVPI